MSEFFLNSGYFGFYLIRPFRFFIGDFRWDYLSLRPFILFINGIYWNMSTSVLLAIYEDMGASTLNGRMKYLLLAGLIVMGFIAFFFDVILAAQYTFCRGILRHHRAFERRSLAVNANDYRTANNLHAPQRFIDNFIVGTFIYAFDLMIYSLAYSLYLMIYACFLIFTLGLVLSVALCALSILVIVLWKGLYACAILSIKPISFGTLSSRAPYLLGALLKVQKSLILGLMANFQYILVYGALAIAVSLTFFRLENSPIKRLAPFLIKFFKFLAYVLGVNLSRVATPANRLNQWQTSHLAPSIHNRPEELSLEDHFKITLRIRHAMLEEFVILQTFAKIVSDTIQLENLALENLLAQETTARLLFETYKKKELIGLLTTEQNRIELEKERLKEVLRGSIDGMHANRSEGIRDVYAPQKVLNIPPELCISTEDALRLRSLPAQEHYLLSGGYGFILRNLQTTIEQMRAQRDLARRNLESLIRSTTEQIGALPVWVGIGTVPGEPVPGMPENLIGTARD